ncbi:DNA polymerase I [Gemmatimonas aurantiaca]|nr:DNA polymerase I [Gemmatimonas aurantiaca]
MGPTAKTSTTTKSISTKSKRKTLYLIDGSALIYRAFFAFIRNPLINSRGENTSSPFGFTGSLLRILREETPDYLAVIFDTKAPTFRHKMYAEYKSTRAKMPDELVAQLPRIQEIVEAFEIPSFKLEGFEADDIIGTLARKGEESGLDVWIVSGDKDFCQLVTERIKIYNSKKSSEKAERLDREGVKEKMGVYPERVIDLLALMGDSSDNVPGVPGVGPKTAVALLEQFGSLDEILARADEIKAKGVRAKVSDNIEKAQLSRKLVTIHLDTPNNLDLDLLRVNSPNQEKLRTLFTELEFNGYLKDLAPAPIISGIAQSGSEDSSDNCNNSVSKSTIDYRLVESIDQLKTLVDSWLVITEIAVDTETTSLNQLSASLVGVSVCPRAGEAYYIPLGHNQKGKNLPFADAIVELKRILETDTVKKTGQNIKYDMHIFANVGVTLRGVDFDTMLAAYTIEPSARRYSLDALAYDKFNYQMQSIKDLIGSGAKQISFAEVPVAEAVFYACEDADYTYRLRGALEPEVARLGLSDLFNNIECPLIEVLFAMEREGVTIDPGFLNTMSEELEKEIDAAQRQIFKETGREFNINSPQQLSAVLFEELGLPTKGKTAKKTGYSTDVRVLEELASLHPVPQLVLQYRQLTKLKNTYVDALPQLIDENTGRVHTTFNQTIAATGRLSSTDPNLQNIPIRTEQGAQVRKAFIPRSKDFQLLTADYSQIELRILAHVSKDAGLISAFNSNEDIHTRTAAEVFAVDLDAVTTEQRRVAKTANFAVIYGVSAYGLSQQSDMDVSEAKEFIETYFKRYPGIKKYIDETIVFARENGYVETLTGRRRGIPDIHSSNFSVRQFAERVATNTPIQGAAADLIKIAMINIHRKIANMKSKMILQVHDELVFDVHNDEVESLSEIVRSEMEGALQLDVPLVVDVGVAANWLAAK